MGVKSIPFVPIRPADKSIPVSVPNFIFKSQDQTQWCWAACAEMALLTSGASDKPQCEIVRDLFGEKKCCDEPGALECNKGCTPDQVTDLYLSLRMDAKRRPLPDPSAGAAVQNIWRIIQDEISSRRPVEIHYDFVNDGSHVVLVSGWDIDDQGRLRFHVADPQELSARYAAENLSTLDQRGKWINMWTGIKPQ